MFTVASTCVIVALSTVLYCMPSAISLTLSGSESWPVIGGRGFLAFSTAWMSARAMVSFGERTPSRVAEEYWAVRIAFIRLCALFGSQFWVATFWKVV